MKLFAVKQKDDGAVQKLRAKVLEKFKAVLFGGTVQNAQGKQSSSPSPVTRSVIFTLKLSPQGGLSEVKDLTLLARPTILKEKLLNAFLKVLKKMEELTV